MKLRMVWGLVGCLVVLSLMMASCSNTPATSTSTGPSTTGTTPEAPTAPMTTASTEAPKYGGQFNMAWPRDITGWDNVFGWEAFADVFKLTNEELATGDWAKGPAGTGETDYAVEMADIWSLRTGSIAESWDYSGLPDGIMVYKIRDGIRWALNSNSEKSRFVNGRELTAEDVAYTLNLYITHPRAYLKTAISILTKAEITAPDEHTVIIKMPVKEGIPAAVTRFPEFARIIPKDLIEKYGPEVLIDWHNSVGSGAFMVTDYVAGSSATLVKNPNYWMKDPVGPGKGNQLPYLSSIKILIITDASTQMSALRTGRADTHYGGAVTYEDYLALKQQKPEMKYTVAPSGQIGPRTSMRQDKADLPFHDIKVRRAMMLALDFQTMNKTLASGLALLPAWPFGYSKDYGAGYLSITDADCPDSVKELYSYNVEKAKTLLKDAGYPNGFKTTVVCPSGQADYYSVLMEYWSKVNITLDIKVLEAGVHQSTAVARNYDGMIFPMGSGAGTFYDCTNFSAAGASNASYVNDAHVDEVKAQMRQLVCEGKQMEALKLHRELMKYALDQVWDIPGVMIGYRTTQWWPWLKNYHGEWMVGYHNILEWTKYVWIDQDLKKSMG